MGKKLDGIVIFSKDYMENDKLITILTQEGILSCKLIGCKKNNARYKSASQIFFFAEFILTKNNSLFYTITNVSSKDSFMQITENYASFLVASEICKLVNKTKCSDDLYETIFLYVLKSFYSLKLYPLKSKIIYQKFYLNFLSLLGYSLNVEQCSDCGLIFKQNEKIFFNPDNNCFSCNFHRMPYSKELTNNSYIKALKKNKLESLLNNEYNKQFIDELDIILKSIEIN